MERKRVQFLVLLTFVVAVTNCAALSAATANKPAITTTTTGKTTTQETTTQETTTQETTTQETTTEETTTEETTPEETTPEETTTEETTTEETTTEETTTEETTTEETTTEETTTAKITTLPPPDSSVTKFTYYLRDPETGVACILANMSISIEIKYITTSLTTKVASLKVPSEVEVRGTCTGKVPTMELIWTEVPPSEDKLNGIALLFQSNNDTSFLYGIAVDIYMDEKHFPDAMYLAGRFSTGVGKLHALSASKDRLYRCVPETVVNAKNMNVTISDVALIAYNSEKSVASRTEENCVAGADVGAIVGGVIGGVVLTAIIIAVIVIWRKKRRQSR